MVDPLVAVSLLVLLSLVVWTGGALAVGAVGGIALVLRLDELRSRTPTRPAGKRRLYLDPQPTETFAPPRAVTGPIQEHAEALAYSDEGEAA